MSTFQIVNIKDEDVDDMIMFIGECPSCARGDHSLIITARKDRVTQGDYRQSLMKIECICCEFKTVRDFKWKQAT